MTPSPTPASGGGPAGGAAARLPATAAETSAERPWPVRLLTAKLTEYVAKAPVVWVEGQILQVVRRPGQSTCYLTLRDTDVDLSFSVTASVRLLDAAGSPTDGAHVVARVRPQLWAKRGSLSLAADDLRPVGVGELLARLERLRRILASEGLFDPQRKRRLPFLPRRVGLICGRASAAERDVVENAARRWPAVTFEIRQVAVQGVNAVTEVTEALRELDADPQVDVVVIARGGGSMEDLLPFSNETLLRAVAACRTPVVSAIGHDVDTPLLDLVADVRASTPTDAASCLVPDVAEEFDRLAALRSRGRGYLHHRLDRELRTLRDLVARPVLARPYVLLDGHATQVATLRERGHRATEARVHRAVDDVGHLRERVRALSPAATLARGYAVVTTGDGTVVRDPAEVARGRRLDVRVHGGHFPVTVAAAKAPGGRAARATGPVEAGGRGAPARDDDGGS